MDSARPTKYFARPTSVHLVSSFLDFLKDIHNDIPNDPIKQEGLHVAINCLKEAFEIKEEIIPDEQPKLIEVFAKHVPPLRAATEQENKEAEAFRVLGLENSSDGDNDEAIKNFTQAIKLNPANAAYYCKRGNVYFSLKKYEEALSDFRRAITVEPSCSKAYSRMGTIHLKKEENALSYQNYKEALKIDSTNNEAKKNIQKVEQKVKDAIPTSSADGEPQLGQLSSVFNNPKLLKIAQIIFSNPKFVKLFENTKLEDLEQKLKVFLL